MGSYKVNVNGTIKEYEEGTRYRQIAEERRGEYENDIIIAICNGKLMELNKRVKRDCEVSFVTTADDIGRKTYIRGVTMLVLKAVYAELGVENVSRLSVSYAVGRGYYCEYDGRTALTEEVLERIEARMRGYVEEDMVFEKRTVSTEDAIELFRKYRMFDKEKLFRYRRSSRVNIYRLGRFEDYFYGFMPPSTGMLKYFKLELYEDGFVFVIPSRENPTEVPEFKPIPKLFQVMREAERWGKLMEIGTVGALNDCIASGKMKDMILIQEALHEKKIAEIAEQVASMEDKKIIMIAGPSSSGKTTFSHRLSVQLSTYGLKPHPIPIDDYFVEREKTPRNAKGDYDYECLEAIDVEQFNKDMMALIEGEEVELPTYNFITGKREYKGRRKRMCQGDILVIEGIHGLNDRLSHALPKENKFKIYISALTQLNIDEHNRIPTTEGRLIRRMVRDSMSRGASAARTIRMWENVRAGEDRYIFPFQEEADAMFNSALIYELAILKQYAEPLLFHIEKDSAEYLEAKRLLKFLEYFIGVTSEGVPSNSILREFVGNSVFHV